MLAALMMERDNDQAHLPGRETLRDKHKQGSSGNQITRPGQV
jgi:hypothetical protein